MAWNVGVRRNNEFVVSTPQKISISWWSLSQLAFNMQSIWEPTSPEYPRIPQTRMVQQESLVFGFNSPILQSLRIIIPFYGQMYLVCIYNIIYICIYIYDILYHIYYNIYIYNNYIIYYIISYYIILYHIISYYIILYHIISYYIILYIIWYIPIYQAPSRWSVGDLLILLLQTLHKSLEVGLELLNLCFLQARNSRRRRTDLVVNM